MVLKVKYTLINKLNYKYPHLMKLEINNNVYFHLTARKYIAINFLLHHFKTKFKNINKFKYINKKSMINYSDLILDKYINPKSPSLLYQVSKWEKEYNLVCNKANSINDKKKLELLYLDFNNKLKIFKLHI